MKKALALLAMIILIASVLVGCGGKDDTPTQTPAPSTPAQPTPETPTPETPTPETPPVTTYTITWVDEKGATLSTSTVNEGTVPSYTYNLTDTAEWDYTFNGWSTSANGQALTSIPAANGNATYYALVSQVKQRYTVTFVSNGGSAVQSQTVEYGAKATEPVDPTLADHRFVGWSTTSDGLNQVDFNAAITGNVTYYAIWNEVVDVKAMLVALLEGYELNPFRYIPESMTPGYSANLVDAEDIITDYSNFVNVSDITYGYGEQWNMVIENLQQSKVFFTVLTVVDTLSSASITAFNNYFDNNPADTAHHEFANGIYNVTINFDGQYLVYVLDYTATLPVLGEQNVQIALVLDSETGAKSARVQLGNSASLRYTLLENSYDFALQYPLVNVAGITGTRHAMFSISDKDGIVSGNIYEYITGTAAGQSIELESAADFYITEDYVTAVGNKASGLVLFDGYVTEVYSAKSGRMLGYEIKETLSSINYDTLWFNLDDIDGINRIKSAEEKGLLSSTKIVFYINGSSDKWESMNVGGFGLNTASRRYDIEFRTQYVYSYDSANDEYVVHEIQVPMLFVQEDNLDTLVDDVETKNDVTIALLVSDSNLNKILDDYDTYVSVFIENSEVFSPELITAYIGNKVEFE